MERRNPTRFPSLRAPIESDWETYKSAHAERPLDTVKLVICQISRAYKLAANKPTILKERPSWFINKEKQELPHYMAHTPHKQDMADEEASALTEKVMKASWIITAAPGERELPLAAPLVRHQFCGRNFDISRPERIQYLNRTSNQFFYYVCNMG